jgi:hypothetical protein
VRWLEVPWKERKKLKKEGIGDGRGKILLCRTIEEERLRRMF